MIRVHTTGLEGERFLQLDEVNIVSQKINWDGKPYILFEHKDYPLGGLYATYDGTYWDCDLD
jgi:hypothetical protein